MISKLHIANYALIDSLDIEFTKGLNIITGETGAGKSIMLGALSLLLGARADSKAIRNAERKSIVEASFNVEGNTALAEWAIRNDVEWDDSECILRREIAPGGRSRAFVNDSPVTVGVLSELGSQLIDIHSQHQNQLLASPAYQLQIIDSIANNAKLLEQYRLEYSQMKAAEKALTEAQNEIERNRADEEFIRFRLNQLKEAMLTPGEQEELENERDLQSNMTQIKQTITDALHHLTDGDTSALSQLAAAVDATEELGEVLEDATELAQRLESARVEIQDVMETLADYDANLGADPQALERIEERLGELYSLQSRHHVDSVEKLIEIRDALQKKLDSIEGGDFAIDELRSEAEKRRKIAKSTAQQLSARRKSAADQFAADLLTVATPLGMKNLRCAILVSPNSELSSTGADLVNFYFAFNKNQQPQPVSGAASGGEVSRLMLSIKSIVAGKLQLPSIVFDEVDTGVSGDVANRMGEMMRDIAAELQVITITHLPQVAAKGQSHFKVFKEDDLDATHTRIRRLSDIEREGEIALMLSGSTTNAAAIANAKALLNN